MYAIAAIVTLIYLVLFFLSLKVSGEDSAVDKNPFSKMAVFLYEKASFLGIFSLKGVKQDLTLLNPGVPFEKILKKYYVKKIKIFLSVFFLGTICAVLSYANSMNGRGIILDGKLYRGDFSEESQNILLTLCGEDSYRLTLAPYILNRGEADKLYEEYLDKLFAHLLGENENSASVNSDLFPESELEGYPFVSEWESDSPDVVNTLGEVSTVQTPQSVTLTVNTMYENMEWKDTIEITVVPLHLSGEEKKKMSIQELIDTTEESSRTVREFTLPQKYMGEDLTWRRKSEDYSILIWVGFACLAIILFLLSDKDLHSELERRKEEIKRDYPDIVQKFVLYMGAGMTARNVFKKIALDYEAGIRQGKEVKPAYEEMLYSYRELLSGVAESDMYGHFGKRTGLQEYIRLCTLLQQNAKKGNAAILERLREEAEKSMSDKLQSGRRLGEEAGTKLLLPMVMMLLVALLIIMVPVFMSSMI